MPLVCVRRTFAKAHDIASTRFTSAIRCTCGDAVHKRNQVHLRCIEQIKCCSHRAANTHQLQRQIRLCWLHPKVWLSRQTWQLVRSIYRTPIAYICIYRCVCVCVCAQCGAAVVVVSTLLVLCSLSCTLSLVVSCTLFSHSVLCSVVHSLSCSVCPLFFVLCCTLFFVLPFSLFFLLFCTLFFVLSFCCLLFLFLFFEFVYLQQ